jgi:hypothetical protein
MIGITVQLIGFGMAGAILSNVASKVARRLRDK